MALLLGGAVATKTMRAVVAAVAVVDLRLGLPVDLRHGREIVAVVVRIRAMAATHTMAVDGTTTTEVPRQPLRLQELLHGIRPRLLLLQAWVAMVVIRARLLIILDMVLLLACHHLPQVLLLQGCRL